MALPTLACGWVGDCKPSAHGPIGYLALSSPDLLSALKALRDFLPLRIPFARLELDFEQDWFALPSAARPAGGT